MHVSVVVCGCYEYRGVLQMYHSQNRGELMPALVVEEPTSTGIPSLSLLDNVPSDPDIDQVSGRT